MGKIQVLSKTVSNMIAAGEVVERPASVVKELLENALDAGATHITVEIKNGGITYIRVADNGHGMSKEDVPVSLLRHATSKISVEKDLEGIKTLGFRGEALSSICAVSKMEIYTKTKEEEMGTYLLAEEGEVIRCDEAGAPLGTTVIVRDLFMNTPARMKFLRKNYTEASYITDIVSRLSLAHVEVSFRLLSDGKELLFTAGDNDLLNTIFSVYGKDIKNTMKPAEHEENGVLVRGFCATGAGARPNRSMQNFFVNGRYIKSPLLARAVEEAYKNELMGGKFPACVLLLTLSPSMVDINVHPTKLEAKFADEKAVYHSVYWAAKNALYQKDEISAVTLSAEEEEPFVTPKPTGRFVADVGKRTGDNSSPFVWKGVTAQKENTPHFAETTLYEKKEEKTLPKTEKPSQAEIVYEKPIWSPSFDVAEKKAEGEEKKEIIQETTNQVEDKSNFYTEKSVKMENEEKTQTSNPPAESSTDKTPAYRICGRVFDTYIIVEKDDQMLLIDQHAAHERLRYEALLKDYEGRKIDSQMLLIPVTLRLTAAEDIQFTEYEDMFFDLGFTVERFGEKAVIIRSAPEALAEDALKALFLEVLGHLAQGKKDARSQKAQRALYSVACKSAVKAGNHLSDAEIRTLLDGVFSLGPVNTCPHGRPITVAMTRTFIEKQFKRIV